MIKKFAKYWLLTFLSIWLISSSCFWIWGLWGDEPNVAFPYQNEDTDALECDSTNLWDCTSIKEDETKQVRDTIIRRLLKVFWLDTSHGKDLKFIDYAKAIINMALWLVAFIALVMTIYTFYMVMFSGSEDWIKKAKWNLVGIFIALGIIWLAWLIVSFIFWRYQSNWQSQQEKIERWEITMSIEKHESNQIYLTI